MKTVTPGTWQYIIYAINYNSYFICFLLTLEIVYSSVDNSMLTKVPPVTLTKKKKKHKK